MILGGEAPDFLRQHVTACGACRVRVERLRAEISAVHQAGLELPGGAGAGSPTVEPDLETASMPTATLHTGASSTSAGPTGPPMPRPESIGRYRIVGELDSGGQALVYRAVHPTLPRDVAIKIAHEPSSIDRSLLKGDAELLCLLDHPNLVGVHDLDLHEGRPFVVMEFVRGRNLSGGTLAFMAPEQARGESQRVGAPSDIFGLGGALYFLLTGQAPFEGKTRDDQWRRASKCDFDRAALRARKVPRALERIVLKAMSAEPKDRFASADDMAKALHAFLHRPRRIAIQAGALLLAALAMVAWSWWPRPVRENGDGRVGPTPGLTVIQPKAAPPTAGPVSTRPLRIESLHVELHARVPDDPTGTIGVGVFAGRLAQDVRVQAQLSGPGYCHLLALNPDGKTQLCYPNKPEAASSLTSTVDFPPDPGSGFGLTDGVGTQVFVLIASAKPLPPYAEWLKALGALPWKPAESGIVWRYDGRHFESEADRGEVRPLADLPPPLEATCRALQSAPGVEAIRAVAFPVKPRREGKSK